MWLAVGAIIVYFRYSSIDLSSVAQSLDDIVEPFRGYLKGFTYELDGEVVNYYSDADIEGLCEYLKSVMLGILGAAMTIISYAASLLTRLVARSFDRESMLPHSAPDTRTSQKDARRAGSRGEAGDGGLAGDA